MHIPGINIIISDALAEDQIILLDPKGVTIDERLALQLLYNHLMKNMNNDAPDIGDQIWDCV